MSNETVDKKDAQDAYMPVQNYTGQGYSFDNGEKTGEFAKHYRQEIINKVNQYFMDKYGLNVTVHNLVGAKDAVVAFVESKQDPKFHTSVIVGVDLQNNKVDEVGAYEGDVEGAITSGLYVMAYEKEFKNLDIFCEQIAQKYPVMGMREEAVNNTMETGYATPYYYTSTLDSFFPNAYKAYTVDHTISKDKIHALISRDLFKQDFDTLEISLTFYIKKRFGNPEQKMANDIIHEFKQTTGLPPGNYGIFVQSNEVLKRTGTAKSHKGTITGKTDIIVKPKR